MSLENYMPDFALEKAYDDRRKLEKHGIKVVFVDLDNLDCLEQSRWYARDAPVVT